jgi:hypothetical protein
MREQKTVSDNEETSIGSGCVNSREAVANSARALPIEGIELNPRLVGQFLYGV